MDPHSFLLLMAALGWENGVEFYIVEQKKGETVFTAPGVEHNVCSYRGAAPLSLNDFADISITRNEVG